MTRGLTRFGHLALGAFLTSRAGWRFHLAIHRVTAGRILGGPLGFRTVVLVTTGRRSGRRLEAPLAALADGAAWIVVASNGGKDRAPGWLHNLRAEPRVRLQVGRDELEVHAREADEGERARLWPRIVEQYAGYETYRRRTSREIPLVILEPRSDAPLDEAARP